MTQYSRNHHDNCSHGCSHSDEEIFEEEDVVIYSDEDFEGMRKAGRLASALLDYITPFIKPAVTTEELDILCHQYIIDHNAVPAPLGYQGFPKSICTSINHVVCHGIPGDKKLQEGDILNVDVAVILDGWYGDTSRMFTIGKVGIKAKKLVKVTYEAMMRGIQTVKPGAYLGDIGYAIQSYAESHRFSVVRDFCGHGIGREFHIAPQVLHFGRPGKGLRLEKGMIFTIEPMLNAGKYDVKVLSDGWTTVTKDKSLSAQWEHTVGVTDTGVEIFTVSS